MYGVTSSEEIPCSVAVNKWKNSPGHLANMAHRGIRRVGCGASNVNGFLIITCRKFFVCLVFNSSIRLRMIYCNFV